MLQIQHLPHLSPGLREQLNVPKHFLLLLHAGAKPHSPHLMGHPASQWVLASSLLAANGEQQALVSLSQKISCSWTCLITVKSISAHQASPQLHTGCIQGHFLCAHRLCWELCCCAQHNSLLGQTQGMFGTLT